MPEEKSHCQVGAPLLFQPFPIADEACAANEQSRQINILPPRGDKIIFHIEKKFLLMIFNGLLTAGQQLIKDHFFEKFPSRPG